MTPPKKKKSPAKKRPAKRKPTRSVAREKKQSRRLSRPVVVSLALGFFAALLCVWALQTLPFFQKEPGKGKPEAFFLQDDSAAQLPLATQSEVAKALRELQDLPFEEEIKPSFEESVKHIDYALMQAAVQARISMENIRSRPVEKKTPSGEAVPVQLVEVVPGAQKAEYMRLLRNALQTWAEEAVLQQQAENEWEITLERVLTHTIRVYPGNRFLDARAEKDQQAEPFSRGLRKEGEPARLVIVMDDLGNSIRTIEQLLALPYPVTLAFWPHGSYTAEGAERAYALGREILVHQPMEPVSYPKMQPGPGALFTHMNRAAVVRLVEQGIGKVPHAAGLNNHMGSRFTQNKEGVEAVADVAAKHGLFILDSLTHNRSGFYRYAAAKGVPALRRNVFLDAEPGRARALAALKQAERIALLTGQAIAIGHPLPDTLAALKQWESRRNRSVHIVSLRDLL